MITITLISGYIGTGKSTIINNILRQNEDLNVKIISYEPANVTRIETIENIRKRYRKKVDIDWIETNSIENLITVIKHNMSQEKVDHIIVEIAGVVSPNPIIKILKNEEEINAHCCLGSVVTVIDVETFWFDFTSNHLILSENELDVDEQMVSDLLVAQIEGSNVLLLNKCKGVGKEDIEDLEWFLSMLQPNAKIMKVGKEIQPIFHKKLVEYNPLTKEARWFSGKNKLEFESFGMISFVYERDVPFNLDRLDKWIRSFPQEILRSEGLIWAEDEEAPFYFSQAGPSLTLSEQEVVASDHEPSASKKTEIRFIGFELEREKIIEQLDKCLATITEFA